MDKKSQNPDLSKTRARIRDVHVKLTKLKEKANRAWRKAVEDKDSREKNSILDSIKKA